jgi:hypothetical protein
MFVIGKTISQIPRCTYSVTTRLASEVTRNPNQKSQKQKKPVRRCLHALQCKLFGLPIGEFELPPTPPELVGFQGFMFKNKDQVIRLEKEAIQYKQMK